MKVKEYYQGEYDQQQKDKEAFEAWLDSLEKQKVKENE